uniref:Two-component response regulator ARR22 n=1 Tax=Cajanus cajan TaxID=3821 RepID=A0A151T5S2_CAJCA|nr:Two-component response regulator ARR22 [Cajanus cajan]
MELSALVVEGDANVRNVHKDLLRLVGNCTTVNSGLQAVILHRMGKRFDVILMDMDLPQLEGIRATNELRVMGVRSLILGMSRSCSKEEVRSRERIMVEDAIDVHYTKPLTAEQLEEALEMLDS